MEIKLRSFCAPEGLPVPEQDFVFFLPICFILVDFRRCYVLTALLLRTGQGCVCPQRVQGASTCPRAGLGCATCSVKCPHSLSSGNTKLNNPGTATSPCRLQRQTSIFRAHRGAKPEGLEGGCPARHAAKPPKGSCLPSASSSVPAGRLHGNTALAFCLCLPLV